MAELVQLNDRLWTVEVTVPEFSVRGAVLLTENQAVVWDTLSHPHDMHEVNALIGDRPYHVIYSHADWDHIWGTAGLGNTPQSIVAHTHCLQRFSEDVPQTLQKMQADQPKQWDDVVLIPPSTTFLHHMVMMIDDIQLELYHLPGHTQDCIVGWLPEFGILLGGDTMETPLPVVEENSDVGHWLSLLVYWSKHENLVQTIPSHGTLDGRMCLDSTIHYLRTLLDGGVFPDYGGLDAFYQTTHEQNLVRIRKS